MNATTPAIDCTIRFDTHGGILTLPHHGRELCVRFTDVGDIAGLLMLHGVHWEVIQEAEALADQAFANHCRVMREHREKARYEAKHGTGIVLGLILGAAMWAVLIFGVAAWIKGAAVITGIGG